MQVIFDGAIDRHLEELTKDIKSLQDQNEYLRKRLQEYNKAEEIKQRDERISELYKRSLAVLAKRENEWHDKFRKTHYEKCGNAGNYIYDLCGTGIGTVVKIECPFCHEKQDITDYESW